MAVAVALFAATSCDLAPASQLRDDPTNSGGATLLTESFDEPTPGFAVEEDDLVRLAVEDGRYIIEIKDASAAQPIRHLFAEALPELRFDAVVSQTSIDGHPALFTSGCWGGSTIYGLVTSSDRRLGLASVDIETHARVPLSPVIHHPALLPAGNPNSISVRCSADPDGSGGSITAWVNDHAVVTGEIDGDAVSFDGVGFFIQPEADGASFTVDDATAYVEDDPRPPRIEPPGDDWGHEPQGFARWGISVDFPSDWIVLDGTSEERFSIGPPDGRGRDWIKIVRLPTALARKLSGDQDAASAFLGSLPGDGATGRAETVQIGGLPGMSMSFGNIDVGGEPHQGEAVLLFRDDDDGTLFICQFTPRHQDEVATAWVLALASLEA